ncbi:Rv0804 family intramembrane glutamic endopeptidase [Mycolicibacterium thermoresistibile]
MTRTPVEPLRAAATAAGIAAALIGWSFRAGGRDPRPWWRHWTTQAVLGTGLAVLTRAPLGLRPPQLWSGLRAGSGAAAAVAGAVAATTAVPAVRDAMAARTLPDAAWRWGLVDIPLGTVWSEEVAFRGALATASAAAFGPRAGRLVQSAVFGLFHVADARATGEPVWGTVLVTGAAGWVFDWLRVRTGSVLAPMLAHLAVNEAGALLAIAVQRRRGVERS